MRLCLAVTLALLALAPADGYDVLIECDCTCTGALSAGQCATIAQTCCVCCMSDEDDPLTFASVSVNRRHWAGHVIAMQCRGGICSMLPQLYSLPNPLLCALVLDGLLMPRFPCSLAICLLFSL